MFCLFKELFIRQTQKRKDIDSLPIHFPAPVQKGTETVYSEIRKANNGK